VLVESIAADAIPEGSYALRLEEIAKAHEGVGIGSYPHFSGAGVRNEIVLRSRDAARLSAAAAQVRALIAQLRAGA
jgi:molybdopterin-biosynthesis enzyme MoeA-like protein